MINYDTGVFAEMFTFYTLVLIGVVAMHRNSPHIDLSKAYRQHSWGGGGGGLIETGLQTPLSSLCMLICKFANIMIETLTSLLCAFCLDGKLNYRVLL